MTVRRWVIGLLIATFAGVLAPAATYAAPTPLPVGTDVDYQLGGNRPVPDNVGIVVRDREAEPAAERYNVCYVNGFQTQPNEKSFWRQHRGLVLKRKGKLVVDSAWGEWLLDLRTPRKRQHLAKIVGKWAAGCAADGFDAVEFDNLDSFTRSHRLLTRQQAIAYAHLLVRKAHRAGLAVGQKNLAGFDGTTIGFDFAVAEECGRWHECSSYTESYGDRVLSVEYRRQRLRVDLPAVRRPARRGPARPGPQSDRCTRVVLNDSALHTTLMGERGPLVAFCHGLFGQGKNWTSIAKALADDHRVLLIDMPHHGRSPWHDSFDYPDVADEVAGLFRADDPVALVGHSMGGKAAMVLALRHPELVERLCVVDVSPVDYDSRSEFSGYIEALLGLDLTTLERRSDADEALAEAVPNPTVRSFLLQNLRHHDEGWSWQPNLAVLGRDLEVLSGWPEEALARSAPYDGSTLWINGQQSAYVSEEYVAAMDRWFPRNRRVTIKGAGHWVHSEQPQVFTEVLRRFLAAR